MNSEKNQNCNPAAAILQIPVSMNGNKGSRRTATAFDKNRENQYSAKMKNRFLSRLGRKRIGK